MSLNRIAMTLHTGRILFWGALFIGLSAQGGRTQEIVPPLQFEYHEVVLPESMDHYADERTRLLDNGAILMWDYQNSYYRKPSGEWVKSPDRFEWSYASENGYVTGWDRNLEIPAIWHPESPEKPYLLFEHAGSYAPIGISNAGEALLVKNMDTEYRLWSTTDFRELNALYPSLNVNNSLWVRTILPDGKIYGLQRVSTERWVSFFLSNGEMTLGPEYTLEVQDVLGAKIYTQSGNTIDRISSDEDRKAWGPDFINVSIPDDFKISALNDHGEFAGTQATEGWGEDYPLLLWTAPDGLIDINEHSPTPKSQTELWFYRALSMNKRRSILAYGLPKEGAFRVAKLYLLTRLQAKQQIDLSIQANSDGELRVDAFAHFVPDSLSLLGSDDLSKWELLEECPNPSPSPHSQFSLEPEQERKFYQVFATPRVDSP